MAELDLAIWGTIRAKWGDLLEHPLFKLPVLRLPDGSQLHLLDQEDSLEVRLQVSADVGGDEPRVRIRADVALESLCEVSIPGVAGAQPLVTFCDVGRFSFQATCSMSDADLLLNSGGTLGGELSVAFETWCSLRFDLLDAIPDGFISLDAGNADGLVPIRLSAGFMVTAEGQTIAAEVDVRIEAGKKDGESSIARVSLFVPGLTQDLPLLHMDLSHAELNLTVAAENGQEGAAAAKTSLSLSGDLCFRFPQLPPSLQPISHYLAALPVFIGGNRHSFLEIPLDFSGKLGCSFDTMGNVSFDLQVFEPAVTIDIFTFFSVLTSGRAEPDPDKNGKAVPINGDMTFRLNGFSFTLDQDNNFTLGFKIGAKFAELEEVTLFLRIAKETAGWQMEVGLEHLAIPLTVPLFPLETRDFDKPDGVYHIQFSQSGSREERTLAAIEAMTQRVQQEIDGLPQKEVWKRTRLYGKIAMMTQLFTLREQLSSDNSKAAFASWVKEMVGAIEKASSPLQADDTGLSLTYSSGDTTHTVCKNLTLVLNDLVLRIPFHNPKDIGIEGSAHLTGFVTPFDGLNKITLAAGISASLIYFQLDAAGMVIPIPDLGTGYSGGSLTVGQFRIGFGYTSRTFAFALAGELVLPEQLVNDLDTSRLLNAGIRLPQQSALNVRIDLMPLVAGKVVIPLPIIQVNIDLRKDYSPGMSQDGEPYWDGLQFIIRDVYRSAFKQFVISPFVGFVPTLSLLFDGDLCLGDERNGFTLIIDDLSINDILFAKYPIPAVFYQEHVFCDNFCIKLRLAGFAICFNLQRPVPRFSPFALFELFALIGDPLYQVDPKGELANSLRATIRDAFIELPDMVRRLFPHVRRRIEISGEITVNLATYIGIIQKMVQLVTPVAKSLYETCRNEWATFKGGSPYHSTSRKPLPTGMVGAHLPATAREAVLQPADKPLAVELMTEEPVTDAAAKIGSLLSRMQEAFGGDRDVLGNTLLRLTGMDPVDPAAIRDKGMVAVREAASKLPARFRKVALAGSLAGFDGAVTLLLVTLDEARAEVARHDAATGSGGMIKVPPGAVISAVPDGTLRPELGSGNTGSSRSSWSPGSAVPDGPAVADFLQKIPLTMPGDGLFDCHSPAASPFAPGGVMEGMNTVLLHKIQALLQHRAPGSDTEAILARFDLELLGQQVQFVGCLAADGSCAMVAMVLLEPFFLGISGGFPSLPLVARGTLELFTSPPGSGGPAAVNVSIAADIPWCPIGPGIVTVTIGEADLTLSGPTAFRINGSGEVSVLDFLDITQGTADLTNDGCSITGEVSLLGATAQGAVRIFPSGVTLEVEGFEKTAGAGESMFSRAGIKCSGLSGRIDRTGVATLEGEGTISALGAAVTGRCRIVLEKGKEPVIEASGALDWQGQRTVHGGIRLAGDQCTITGGLHKAYNSAAGLPAGIQLAMDVSGSITLNRYGMVAGIDLVGKWIVGMRVTVGECTKLLPLAFDSFTVQKMVNGSCRLLQVDSFVIPAFDGSVDFSLPELPLPVLTKRTDLPLVTIPNFSGTAKLPSIRFKYKKSAPWNSTISYDGGDNLSLSKNDPPEISIPSYETAWGEVSSFPTTGSITVDDSNRFKLVLGDDQATIPLPLQQVPGFSLFLHWNPQMLEFEVNTSEVTMITIIGIDFDPIFMGMEHIRFANNGNAIMDLSGWKIRDAAREANWYVFAEGVTLEPGQELRLWSGKGTNDTANLYWQRSKAVWNNRGDTAILMDRNGMERARFSYAPTKRTGRGRPAGPVT